MAKQIKVIKCPQCGNTKPLTIGKDHYRCDKCGTEFFLDNDDVNINVNHRYEHKSASETSSLKGLWITMIIVFIVGMMLATKFCVSMVSRSARNAVTTTQRAPERPKVQTDKHFFSVLLPANGVGTAFYITGKGQKTYARFVDVATGNVLKEGELPIVVTRKQNIEYRRFLSDGSYYVIINENRIYKIIPESYTFTDVTTEICARKPALEAGLMAVAFVPEAKGEGFRIHTNLGKDLFYFPKADQLYTEKAFRFVAEDNSKPLLPGSKNVTYYLFLNKESAHSSNVAQLFEVIYKFNDGGPENKLQRLDATALKNLDKYRIVSCKPITDERIYFSPEILLYDDLNILIAYKPSLADDAGTNVQLLDTAGNIVWTKQFKSNEPNMYAVRTNRGFMLQTSEAGFCEISVNGQDVQIFKIQ